MSRQAVEPSFPSYSRPQANALSADELQQLSRILTRLGVSKPEPGGNPDHELYALDSIEPGASALAQAKSIYGLRQRRTRFFPSMMLGETGWDILLVLYIHDGLTRLCVKDVGQLIDAPTTTVLRWLKILEDDNFISTRKHHLDRRVTLLDLTDMGRERFSAFLTDTTNWPTGR